MLLDLNIEAKFAVIAKNLCIIMIIQTMVHNCENIEFNSVSCPRHFNMCEWRLNCTDINISSARLQCDNPEKVIVLYLDNNEINFIDNNTFEGLTKLNTLSLTNNKINKIENHTFKALKNLKYLDLRNNLIKEIEENSFQNLKYIWRIDLEHNELIRINSGVFTNCDKLYQVYLTNNNIEEIDENSFKENSIVEHFYSAHNKISNLKFVKNFSKLRFLDLSYNNIQKIPANTLLHLKALKTLDLSYNELEILNSGTFSELSSLENLSLSNNKLKYLGEGPFDYLHKLDHLDFSNNYLKQFSYSLIFEERNNLNLYIYIDNNIWYCKFLHAIKQLRWIQLRYEHVNKNSSNIDGIPCIDKQTYSDRITSTTKNQLTTLLKNKFKFTAAAKFNATTVATPFRENLITSTFLKISVTTFSSSLEVTPTNQTTTTQIMDISPRYRSISLPEIKINITPYIVAIVVVILIITVVILSVMLTRRRFSHPRNNELDYSKDGYLLPDFPGPRRSNFYVTLESYNTYEEINEDDHLYEEINVTYL